MKLVFSDFDQTISAFDTLLPFAHFLLHQQGRRHRYPLVFFHYARFRAGLLGDYDFRTRLCRLLVTGMTNHQIAAIAEKFHAHYSGTIINQSVWGRVREHAAPDGRLIVLSTNFDFVIAPLQKLLPGLEIHATQAALESGRYTGKLASHVGSSADKLQLFETISSAKQATETVGFGDSHTDYGFLGRCQKAWLVVHPQRSLLQKSMQSVRCCTGGFAHTPASLRTELRPFSR